MYLPCSVFKGSGDLFTFLGGSRHAYENPLIPFWIEKSEFTFSSLSKKLGSMHHLLYQLSYNKKLPEDKW